MLADEAEQAKKAGTIAATLATDLQKALEYISLFRLWALHGPLQFPTQLLCFMCEIYTWRRTVGYRGAVSKIWVWTTTAIIAGSTFATRAIKLYAYRLLDGAEKMWELEVKLFIDDVSFQARGIEKEVLQRLQAVATYYIDAAESTGVPVSRGVGGKSYLLAASLSTGLKAMGWCKRLGLGLRSTGVQLGVGVAAGGNICNAPRERGWQHA